MNRFVILSFILLVTAIIKIGLLIPQKEISEEIINLTYRYDDIKNKMQYFLTFEDSLIGSLQFREKVLDTISTYSGFDDLVVYNRREVTKTLEQSEQLLIERKEI